MPTRELSGGQRKLVALAACLARRPELLLLDEPEAHLDMGRREQLERLIEGFDGAVVMVSHDRAALDASVEAIAELEGGRIRVWPGNYNYSAYTLARRLELERQRERWVTQRKEIARLEEAIRRFRHWAHIRVNERAARQARVKQAQIDRMEKVERPVFERRRMALELRGAARGGRRVAAVEGVDVAFGAEPCCSTWSSHTVLDALRAGRSMSEEAGVRLLMGFLFDYEQLRRPVASLSGGERTRLAFLLRMQDAPNCLVLDEPTNHLDVDSIEVLEAALERFDGTVVPSRTIAISWTGSPTGSSWSPTGRPRVRGWVVGERRPDRGGGLTRAQAAGERR